MPPNKSMAAAQAMAKLPARPINAPAQMTSPTAGRSNGGGLGRKPPPGKPLPQAGANNQAEVMAAMSARIAELEGRLSVLESRLMIGPSGITLNCAGSLSINAAMTSINASSIQLNAAVTMSTGIMQCDTLVATHVAGGSYTPGPGNVW
ncbi:hypothetical protein [uncultured Rhodospira sp.]|uniref:hypothetical protein n=1 Tax=uncultured Rhodospira sp. TaxID=1936189 RepID=UPI00261BE7A0|nr:hypothetical protein [uncultured Rhodospira sp.]